MEQIPQLKWHLMAQGTALINESEMAALILNILIRMCRFYPSRDGEGGIVRPLPRAKRLLSEPTTLPHIVQLLLTFDPRLVEKVVTLLNVIMEVCVCVCVRMWVGGCGCGCTFVSIYTHASSECCPHTCTCSHLSSTLFLRIILSCLEYSQLVSSSSSLCTLAPTFCPSLSSSGILT